MRPRGRFSLLPALPRGKGCAPKGSGGRERSPDPARGSGAGSWVVCPGPGRLPSGSSAGAVVCEGRDLGAAALEGPCAPRGSEVRGPGPTGQLRGPSRFRFTVCSQKVSVGSDLDRNQIERSKTNAVPGRVETLGSSQRFPLGSVLLSELSSRQPSRHGEGSSEASKRGLARAGLSGAFTRAFSCRAPSHERRSPRGPAAPEQPVLQRPAQKRPRAAGEALARLLRCWDNARGGTLAIERFLGR